MSVTVYQFTFSQDHPPYAAGEVAAFPADQAAALFAAQVGTLSGGDQTTLASQISAAQAANPKKPITATVVINPDGTFSLKTPPGLPNYGTN